MADEWGITDGYWDVDGEWHPTSDETRALLRAAMGHPEPGTGVWFVRQGRTDGFWNPCRIVLEDGSDLGELDGLPADLPLGYHHLLPCDGSPASELIVHPGDCPELPVAWGVAVQTYALWSERSWGIGDLRDLRDLATAVVSHGGGALLMSPLHQPVPVPPLEPSPYYPSSRKATNPLALAMDGPPPEHLRCDPDSLVDRDAAWVAKLAVWEAEFDALDPATVAAIEPSTTSWWNAGAELSARDAEGSAPPAPEAIARRAALHEWLQQRVEVQLAQVAETGVAVIGDLAVGFSPGGADGAEYADVLAPDLRLGAPPDPFNELGQDWGIAPFVPWKLRACGYRPFIETVRAALRGVQGLRIDHAMGLFRQFLIPAGGSPADGAYVEFPAEDLLAILCLEATRAGAFVIGEDLGTVLPYIRTMLAECRIAGTKVMWFEPDDPADWPPSTLATVTTHDLPTIAAVFLDEDGSDEMRERLDLVAPDAMRPTDAIDAAHRTLLRAGSRIRLLTTDDLAATPRRVNLPGLNDYPSWRVRLPISVDELAERLPSPTLEPVV